MVTIKVDDRLGRAPALCTATVGNWIIFALLVSSFVVGAFCKHQVSHPLAVSLSENPKVPSWDALHKSYDCCPSVPPDNNDTRHDRGGHHHQMASKFCENN